MPEQNNPVVPTIGTPNESVNPAPAAQPQPAPTPAPVAQPATPEVKVTTVNFNSGNAAFDAAVNSMASSAGVTDADVQRAFGLALERNDPTLIDKAFIAEKFGANATAFNTIAESIVAEQKARVEQLASTVNQAITEVAGSKEAWDKHVAAFKETAPQHIQAAAKAMMDAGFIKEGIQFVMSNTNGTVVPSTGNLIGGVPAGQVAGLSADEFRAEMAKLKQEAGNRSLETGVFRERYDNLVKQRMIGRDAGR